MCLEIMVKLDIGEKSYSILFEENDIGRETVEPIYAYTNEKALCFDLSTKPQGVRIHRLLYVIS